MRSTVNRCRGTRVVSARTAATALISTESARHADYSLLHDESGVLQSPQEMVDTSARMFAEQRDQAMAMESGTTTDCSRLDDLDALHDGADVLDSGMPPTVDDMSFTAAAAHEWC